MNPSDTMPVILSHRVRAPAATSACAPFGRPVWSGAFTTSTAPTLWVHPCCGRADIGTFRKQVATGKVTTNDRVDRCVAARAAGVPASVFGGACRLSAPAVVSRHWHGMRDTHRDGRTDARTAVGRTQLQLLWWPK